MTTCTRCHRPLKRPPIMVGDYAFGPQCARAMFGAKPKRQKRDPVQRDDRTADLFEVRG